MPFFASNPFRPVDGMSWVHYVFPDGFLTTFPSAFDHEAASARANGHGRPMPLPPQVYPASLTG